MDFDSSVSFEEDRVVQFTVFLENRVGRLLDLVRLMETADIHIVALSIIDTSDAAIDRIIVDDPDRARELLREHGWVFTETTVLAVELPGVTDLKRVLTALLQGECNVHFLYPFISRPRDNVCVAFHVEDEDCARSVLSAAGLNVLTQRDISR